jgi:hypothetical protein
MPLTLLTLLIHSPHATFALSTRHFCTPHTPLLHSPHATFVLPTQAGGVGVQAGGVVMSPILVTSEAGVEFALVTPRGWGCSDSQEGCGDDSTAILTVTDAATGLNVPVQHSLDVWRFATKAGGSYVVQTVLAPRSVPMVPI